MIEITYSPVQIRVSIQDDGQGFDQDELHDGLGITGMKERAARIGGNLAIDSHIGQGTEISVTVDAGSLSPDRRGG